MINVGIIGGGNISHAHIKAYNSFPDRCRIIAISDMYPEKAEAIKDKYNLNAAIYNDYVELITKNDLDLVSICTPPFTHSKITIDCLKRGIDVLCEKPMASSLEECDEMIRVSLETGRRLSIVSQNRFKTPIMKVKRLLDSNAAGKVLHVQVDSLWWRGHSYFDLWWRGTWEKEGGGCTLNHAVHHIDMLCWIKGLPREITAVLGNLNHDNSEVEDFSVALSRYDDGSVSSLTSSLVHHGEEQKLIFQCEKAKISVPWNVLANKSKPDGFGEPDALTQSTIEAAYEAIPNLEYEGHAGQIDDCLSAIEENRKCLITGEDGRTALEFITAVYKSGFNEQKVILPLSKDDPFYTLDGMRKNVRRFNKKIEHAIY